MKKFVFTYFVGDQQAARSEFEATGNTSIEITGPHEVSVTAQDFDAARTMVISAAKQEHGNDSIINAMYIHNTTDDIGTNVDNNDDYPGGIWTELEYSEPR